jgi:lipopolysaccharide/colanic/teichoic acid biosynthesis glycosyltransferase
MDMNYKDFSAAPLDVDIADHRHSINQSSKSHRILFIGDKDSQYIKLLAIFQNRDVITFNSYNAAAYHLQHQPIGSNDFPDIIIGNYNEKFPKELNEFSQFIQKTDGICLIPFILIANKDNMGNASGPIPGIDDIVRNDISVEHFWGKVELLKKFKALKQAQVKFIHSHKSMIPADRRVLYKIDAFFRRIMDILISVIAIIILAPILLAVAVIIKLTSNGPVFYTSYRAGSNYRIFKFIKFRTMVVEADHNLSSLKILNQYRPTGDNTAVFFKVSNDPRITAFGKFLRNTSLDELPQLLNVLKGDMSLVGNRPLPLYEARTLTTDRHAERFNAPAGITGLWQISKRGQKEMSAEERITLDINYARNNSFVNDIQIILKTPKALIQKDNV